MPKYICTDLIWDIVQYIPIGHLEYVSKVHPIFITEIFNAGIRLVIVRSPTRDHLIDIIRMKAMVIRFDSGFTDILIKARSLMTTLSGSCQLGSYKSLKRETDFYNGIVVSKIEWTNDTEYKIDLDKECMVDPEHGIIVYNDLEHGSCQFICSSNLRVLMNNGLKVSRKVCVQKAVDDKVDYIDPDNKLYIKKGYIGVPVFNVGSFTMIFRDGKFI